MSSVNNMEKPINLRLLKTDEMEKDYEIILQNDIWKNNLLLLKKGINLNTIILDKLLNFGVKEAYVNLNPIGSIMATEIKDRELIKNQVALILNKDINEISKNAKLLIKAGFNEQNIFAALDQSQIEKYMKNAALMYLFIDNTLFSKDFIAKVAENLGNRSLSIFVLNAQTFNQIKQLQKISSERKNIEIKILHKPLDSSYIKALISLSCTTKFQKLVQKAENNPIGA